MTEWFKQQWDENPTPFLGLDSIVIYSNESIGLFAITSNALHFSWDHNNDYKAIALIAEKNVSGKPYIICLDNEIEKVQNWNKGNCSITTIENFLNDFPKNIIEIQKRILLNFSTKYPKYGQEFEQIDDFELYSENENDFYFILKSLTEKGYINAKFSRTGNHKIIMASAISISEIGWIEIEKIIRSNDKKKVFVAMSFESELDKASAAIRKAISETGLVPMQINTKQYNSEISGEILQEINQSSLLIADVTHQKNGVYFEAGFAMGQKKEVIWCCRGDDLDNVHFDTRQYNHIVWSDENDLYNKLKDRILGTIVLKSDG